MTATVLLTNPICRCSALCHRALCPDCGGYLARCAVSPEAAQAIAERLPHRCRPFGVYLPEVPMPNTSPHTCHAEGCTTPCPPSRLMCLPHWRRVPKRLADALWLVYVPGQENRKDPTPEYLVAAEACIVAVAVKEGLQTEADAAARVENLRSALGLPALGLDPDPRLPLA